MRVDRHDHPALKTTLGRSEKIQVACLDQAATERERSGRKKWEEEVGDEPEVAKGNGISPLGRRREG